MENRLLHSNHEHWARVRSTVNPVLIQPKTAKDYIPPIDLVVKEFIEVIRQKRDSKTMEVDGEFKEVLYNWTLESIALIALDTRLQCFDEKNKDPDADILINGLHSYFELSFELDIKPSAWRCFATPKFNQMMKSLDDVTGVAIKYVDKATRKMKQEAPKKHHEMSVLEKLIQIDRKTAVLMAIDMLFAGIDTVSRC